MKSLFILLISITTLSCSSENTPENASTNETTNYQLSNNLNYNAVLQQIGTQKLGSAVEQPNSDGSLGRNKDGYFHVRFQMNMSRISDYAVVSENIQSLEALLSTFTYAFNRQLNDGSFTLVIPDELLNSPSFTPPTQGDLVSGTAFFASSLGLALTTLENSGWYTQGTETQTLREEIRKLHPKFEKTLDYLIVNKDILNQVDANAPNRLLFNALAFYTLGNYLSRNDAVQIAREFIATALAQTDTTQGYFIEGGGWDSSYNGVAIKLALELYLITTDNSLKNMLREPIIKATLWQLSRIKVNGEISTEGNTRVFPGGEAFLGVEKGVDYVKTIKALYYFGHLTQLQSVIATGDKVLNFYN